MVRNARLRQVSHIKDWEDFGFEQDAQINGYVTSSQICVLECFSADSQIRDENASVDA